VEASPLNGQDRPGLHLVDKLAFHEDLAEVLRGSALPPEAQDLVEVSHRQQTVIDGDAAEENLVAGIHTGTPPRA
jgi:hypothetical protein